MADHALRMVSSVPLERRGNVNCIGFSPDGRNYAWGYDNGLIGVQRWRQIPTTIRANADSIFALGWAPDGESFVAGDGRGQLIFVNRSGQFRIEEVHEAPIWSLDSSPKNRREKEFDNCRAKVRRQGDRRSVEWLCRRDGRRLRACWPACDGCQGSGESGCWRAGRRAVCERTERAAPPEPPWG
jgi:hypothetical protein